MVLFISHNCCQGRTVVAGGRRAGGLVSHCFPVTATLWDQRLWPLGDPKLRAPPGPRGLLEMTQIGPTCAMISC